MHTYTGNLENIKDIDDNPPNYEFTKVDIQNKEKIEEIFQNNGSSSAVNFAGEYR